MSQAARTALAGKGRITVRSCGRNGELRRLLRCVTAFVLVAEPQWLHREQGVSPGQKEVSLGIRNVAVTWSQKSIR